MTPEQRQAVYHAWLKAPGHFNEIDLIRMAEEATLADRERQAGEAGALEAFDDAVETELLRVSTVPYNSHDICRWFAANVRCRLASLPAPQAVQADNTKMWAVHIIGPDDVHAAPDREVADAACIALNWSFKRTGQDDLCRAEVIEWPHGYESWTAQKDLFQLVAAPSPDGKAEQAEAPSDAAREVLAAGIVHHYGVPEETSFACARRVLALATQPTASNAGEREDFEAWADRTQPAYWRTTAWAREAWPMWRDMRAALATKPPAGEQKPVGQIVDPGNERDMPRVKWFARVDRGAHLYTAPQLEQVAQDREHAENYRLIRRGQHWSVIDGIGNTLRGDDLDAAVEAIRAARARGEGERS